MAGPDEDAQQKLMLLSKGLHTAMLATRGPDGTFRSRPVSAADTEFDGDLNFLAGEGSGKVHDLEPEDETVIPFADAGKGRVEEFADPTATLTGAPSKPVGEHGKVAL